MKMRLSFLLHNLDHGLESLVIAAFFTSIMLSFFGALGAPLLYLGVGGLLTALLYRTGGTKQTLDVAPFTQLDRFNRNLIWLLLGAFVLIALFTTPTSADGQRIKLARLIMGINTGSLWNTGSVDALSTMYIFPTAYYAVFSFIEALHLPQIAYSTFNTVLMCGSALSLARIVGVSTPLQIVCLFMFMLCPQLVFSGLEEHEEALTFFLACRACYWLVAAPTLKRALFFGLFTAVLCIAVKPPAALFLPFALLVLAYSHSEYKRINYWLKPSTLAIAGAFLVPIVAVILLPDAMVNAAEHRDFSGQLARLSAYHAKSPLSCAPSHFLVRMFEFYVDGLRAILFAFHINLAHIMPDISLLSAGCSAEDTSLSAYFSYAAPSRESMMFAFIPLLALAGAALLKGKQRRIAVLCSATFILTLALYSMKFSYWWGTSRYFMVGLLILLPAFMLTLQELQQKLQRRRFKILLLLLALPAFSIVLRSVEVIPQAVLQGGKMNYRSGELLGELRTMQTPVNIYFNDLMPFYTLLKNIPSHAVTLKKELMPDVTNIIGIPTTFSSAANWHDSYWLLPLPDTKGSFHFTGPVRKNFGNAVPSQFYIGDLSRVSTAEPRYSIVRYDPSSTPSAWLKTLSKRYHLTPLGKRLFISEGREGLCLEYENKTLKWATGTLEECRGN